MKKLLLIDMLRSWINRRCVDPEVIVLLMTLFISVLLVIAMSHILMPVLVSIVLSYLLHSVVVWLHSYKVPRLAAILLVYIVFLSLVLGSLFILLPLLLQQVWHLFDELPSMIDRGRIFLNHLSAQHPDFLPATVLRENIGILQGSMTHLGKVILSYSLTSISSLVQLGIYFVLVPLMVFFFLKDKGVILSYLSQYCPTYRCSVQAVATQINRKLGCYIRGRVLEMLIVGTLMALIGIMWHLPYTFLTASLVGLSVLIPFIGAVIVSLFVAIIAFLAWGVDQVFINFMLVYAALVVLDANLLVPLLFSETMDLHPVVIIVAVLFFGALWGFWGIFFAIPLATVVNVVLQACLRSNSGSCV